MPLDEESTLYMKCVGVFLAEGDTIPLKELWCVLEDCVISTEDGSLFYPTLSAFTGDDDNEFAYFKWDEDGTTCSAKFAEGPNRRVKVHGSTFDLVDTDGDELTFYVLASRQF